jgi:molecular chaperone DnaJ
MYNKDPYETLGLAPTASDDEIKSRYRELIRKYHPDNYVGADQTLVELANEKFTDVQGAYNEIMERRSLGDYTGGARGQRNGSYNNPNQGSYNGNPYGQGGYGGNPYGNQNQQPYQQNYQNYGNYYGRPARYNGGDGCGTGNLCCDLWCADTLCECMGGDICGCL